MTHNKETFQPIRYYMKNLPVINSLKYQINNTIYTADIYNKLYNDIRNRYLYDELDLIGYMNLVDFLSKWRSRNAGL